jgi:hypothetical protein
MSNYYYLSRIPGYMWTSGGNAIDYQDTFCRRGKSTDSAIANSNRKEWATNEVVLKRPYFNSGEWPSYIGAANKKLLPLGLLVSKDGDGKTYKGLIVSEQNLKKALEIDSRLIESKTRLITKDGNITFEVYEFFTDNFVFHVMPNKDLDLKVVELFFQNNK